MTATKIEFDEGNATAFWKTEGDTLIQGGTAWNVGPAGHVQVFPLAFAHGADAVELTPISGGRAWSEKVPGDFSMTTRVRLHCEPAGHVTWKAYGRKPL